jgi:hypothetical protein
VAAEDFEAIYQDLRTRMLRAAPGMIVAKDVCGALSLNASWSHPMKPQGPMWFGKVEIGKAYVSYHLMAVYTSPQLAARIPPALKKRMQGKSCFNFRAVDAALFDALEGLTAQAAAHFAQPPGSKSSV